MLYLTISKNAFVSRYIFGLNYLSELECGCVLFIKPWHPRTANFWVKIRTHTRHISEFFWNGKHRRWLFTPDLRLFKPNAARHEGISTNSPTQHWKTTNIWLVVTSSQDLFLRRIAESSQPIVLFFKPWVQQTIFVGTNNAVFNTDIFWRR